MGFQEKTHAASFALLLETLHRELGVTTKLLAQIEHESVCVRLDAEACVDQALRCCDLDDRVRQKRLPGRQQLDEGDNRIVTMS